MQMFFNAIIIIEATANMEKNVVTNITRLLVKKGFVQIENVSLDIHSFVNLEIFANTFAKENVHIIMRFLRAKQTWRLLKK